MIFIRRFFTGLLLLIVLAAVRLSMILAEALAQTLAAKPLHVALVFIGTAILVAVLCWIGWAAEYLARFSNEG